MSNIIQASIEQCQNALIKLTKFLKGGEESQLVGFDRLQMTTSQTQIFFDIIMDSIEEMTRGCGSRNCHQQRDLFTGNVSWAIPSKGILDVIKRVVGHEFVIEAAAGSGIWSLLMGLSGIVVHSTDIQRTGSYLNSCYISKSLGRFPVCQEEFPYCDVLFLSWPSYGKSWATDIVKTFTGNTIIFIGEGRDGCTGDDSLFDEFEANWNETECHSMENWNFIYDFLSVYRRKIPTPNKRLQLRETILSIELPSKTGFMNSRKQLLLDAIDGDTILLKETILSEGFARFNYIGWFQRGIKLFSKLIAEDERKREEELDAQLEKDLLLASQISLIEKKSDEEWTVIGTPKPKKQSSHSKFDTPARIRPNYHRNQKSVIRCFEVPTKLGKLRQNLVVSK